MKVRYDIITCFVVRKPSAGGWQFLQMLRAANDNLGGTWQIVRGSCEKEELPITGALRELREETGLYPDEFYRLGNVELFFTPPDTINHSVVFCAVVSETARIILNDEHEDFRWIDDSEFDALAMWASEKPLVEEVRREVFRSGLAKSHLRIDLSAHRR